MVKVWVSGFCVITWFNGMVEFLVNGPMVVLGNCDWVNTWLPTYLLCRKIRSSHSSLMMIFFFICLNLCLGRPFGFLI